MTEEYEASWANEEFVDVSFGDKRLQWRNANCRVYRGWCSDREDPEALRTLERPEAASSSCFYDALEPHPTGSGGT